MQKEGIDNNHVDLNIAFQFELTFGLLILIQDSGDTRFIINITEETAVKISSEFDSSELIAMNICDEQNDTSLVLTKSKKNYFTYTN